MISNCELLGSIYKKSLAIQLTSSRCVRSQSLAFGIESLTIHSSRFFFQKDKIFLRDFLKSLKRRNTFREKKLIFMSEHTFYIIHIFHRYARSSASNGPY